MSHLRDDTERKKLRESLSGISCYPLPFMRRSEEIYEANPVFFDGTADSLTRGAGLTGAADGANAMVSLWFRRAAVGATEETFMDNTNGRFRVLSSITHVPTVTLRGITGTILFQATGSALSNTNWHHIIAARNGTDAFIYIDGVAGTVGTNTAGNIDFTVADWSIGVRADGTVRFDGDLADIWAGAQYLDLSVAGNREKFIKNGRPVDLGAAGATPTGVSPLIYLRGATDAWHTNKGTGGGFTLNGALTAGTGPVQL